MRVEEEKVKEGRRRELANRIKKDGKIGEVEKKKTQVKERFEWREGKEQKEITENGCYLSKIAERKQDIEENNRRNKRQKVKGQGEEQEQ